MQVLSQLSVDRFLSDCLPAGAPDRTARFLDTQLASARGDAGAMASGKTSRPSKSRLKRRRSSESLQGHFRRKSTIFQKYPRYCWKFYDLSGHVLRDTARLSQRYPPIARYGFFAVSTWPIGCDTPSPFSEHFPLGEHAEWRCDTPPPPSKGVSQRYLRDTL